MSSKKQLRIVDKASLRQYILDCFDGEENGVENTPEAIYKLFLSEQKHNLVYYKGDEEKTFIEFIYGLPNYFHMDYGNQEIFELIEKFKLPIDIESDDFYKEFARAIYKEWKAMIKENFEKQMSTKEGILQACTVHDLVVKLPEGQLDRKLYVEVKQALELIGGKWKGGKVNGFEFIQDPTELLAEIANGEKRNLKKEFQFFGTPADLCDEMVREAEIEPHHKILEPSAGQGAIMSAVLRAVSLKSKIEYCELMNVNRIVISTNQDLTQSSECIEEDFTLLSFDFKYDRILGNPPFAKNADVTHIRKMFEHLRPGGRLVTLASRHWMLSNNKKETGFRNWLEEIGATQIDIDAGRFKESGTGIATVMLIIDKPL